jgi:hypothetical protein
MSAKRIGAEVVIIVVLVIALIGVWWWKDRAAAAAVTEERVVCEAQTTAAGEQAEMWAASLAEGEAQAVLRAFAAGVLPATLAGRMESLDQAVGSLLELPGVAAAHVVGSDGAVLASSDRKLTTTGTLPESARWVLETIAPTTRPGATEGTLELAAPLGGAAGPAGYLWLEYRTGAVADAARPEGAGATAETAETAPDTV